MIDIHTWTDKIERGLCPHVGCNGHLVLVRDEEAKEYECSDCKHEVVTTHPVPIPEFVN